MSFKTNQEKIDALTLQIHNPNVVGSGFIQHPPQRPFERPMLMQPGTIQHDELPEWFTAGGPARQAPQPRPQATNGIRAGPAPPARPHIPGYSAPAPVQRPQYQGQRAGGATQQVQARPQSGPRQPAPRAPAPSGGRGPRPVFNGPAKHAAPAAPPQQQQPRPAPARIIPVPAQKPGLVAQKPAMFAQRPAAPAQKPAAPAPRPVEVLKPKPPTAQAADEGDHKQLSKSAKAKLRKKMREGKIAGQ